ncbi:hypothetical protein EON81_23660 [bacterium]|nr:MAG: hypothetical protein EON81_23660 [bacterium]
MSAPGTPVKGPIADLSYRNYDGGLNPPAARWWAIARMGIRQTLRKRGFWWWSVASGYWYLVLMAIFYFVDTLGGQQLSPNGKNPVIEAIKWKDQFVHGYSFAQLLFFILALLTATGTIAADNRANALLVYLSKPCTKLDYVIGKWMGVFVPLSVVAFLQMGLFWLYGALSFREYGFITTDPLLLPKLAVVAMSGAALHASLALAISSMFNQPRVAGATYAGIYFLSNFFTKAMQVSHALYVNQQTPVPTWIDRLFYGSIDGMNIAMAKLILGTSGSPLFQNGFAGGVRTASRGARGTARASLGGGPQASDFLIPSPPLEIFLPIFLILVLGGAWIAWSRVRAVEVV